MALVVVERVLEPASDPAELQARQSAAAWCLETWRVRPLRSFVSVDGQYAVCLYEAPDAESVRQVQRSARLPFEHVWNATAVVDELGEPPPGYRLAIAQRSFPEGITLEEVQYRATDPRGCRKRLRLHLFGVFLAADRQRLCCMYYTPDLESIRMSSRESGLPYERLWAGELAWSSG
jgi:hypothetical protein